MKCAEAVEWMHRYVDHDLNDEETSLLFEHIRNCSDCAYEFELLNELSAKLSKLPDVTPRFSLVDQIMPQLDEIDRARREEGSTLERDSIIGAVAASAGTNPGSVGSRRDKKTAQRSRTRSIRTGVLGTVAAAVILGIFITQYEPRTIPNAELSTAYQSTDSSNNQPAANEFLARSMDEAESNASQMTDGAAEKSGAGPGNEGDMSGFTKSGEPSSAGDARQGEKASANQSGAKGDESSPAPGNTPAESNGDAGGRPTSDVSRSTAPNDGTPEGSPAQGEPAQSSSADDGELEEHNMEVAPFAQDEPISSQDPAQKMGIAKVLEEWSSPDETHRAVLLGNHLYIYQEDNESSLLVADEQVTGTWIKGEWSSDGTKFTYEADVDGSVTKHSVEIKPSADAENSSQNQ